MKQTKWRLTTERSPTVIHKNKKKTIPRKRKHKNATGDAEIKRH